jgi:hypothetical protein
VELGAWSIVVLIAILAVFVRIRICPVITFVCPKCDKPADGRRCYECRLEAAPDDTPTEMSVTQFIAMSIRHARSRQPWEWNPF